MKGKRKKENFRKLARIVVLDQKIPSPVCVNPDREELCAETYDAALALRLDPAETIRKIIEREMHCISADADSDPSRLRILLSSAAKKRRKRIMRSF